MITKEKMRRAYMRVITAMVVVLMLFTVCNAGVYAAVPSGSSAQMGVSSEQQSGDSKVWTPPASSTAL